MQNLLHIIYLKVVDMSLLNFPVDNWKMCQSKRFLCTRRLLKKNYSCPTCTEKRKERLRLHVVTRRPMSIFRSGTVNSVLPQVTLRVLFAVINLRYSFLFLLYLHSLLICIYTEVVI